MKCEKHAVGRHSARWDSLCELLRWMSAPSPPDPFATLPSSCSVRPEAEFCGPHQWATWHPGISYRESGEDVGEKEEKWGQRNWCWGSLLGGHGSGWALLAQVSHSCSIPSSHQPQCHSLERLRHPCSLPRAWAHFCKVLFRRTLDLDFHSELPSFEYVLSFAGNWYPVCLKPLWCSDTNISATFLLKLTLKTTVKSKLLQTILVFPTKSKFLLSSLTQHLESHDYWYTESTFLVNCYFLSRSILECGLATRIHTSFQGTKKKGTSFWIIQKTSLYCHLKNNN